MLVCVIQISNTDYFMPQTSALEGSATRLSALFKLLPGLIPFFICLAILLLWFYLFDVLDSNFLCCLNLMYVFIVLVKFGKLSDRLLGNSCSVGFRYVLKV